MDRCLFLSAGLGFCGLLLDAAGKSLGHATFESAASYLMVPCWALVGLMAVTMVVGTVIHLAARIRCKR